MVFLSIRVVSCTKCIKSDGFHPFRSVKFQGLLSVQRQILSCFFSYYNVSFYNVSLCHRELFEFSNHKKQTPPWHILSSHAVACDNLHLRASTHHWRVSAFCVIGNSSEFPITRKNASGYRYNIHEASFSSYLVHHTFQIFHFSGDHDSGPGIHRLDQHSHIGLSELDPAEGSILCTGLLAVYHQRRIAFRVLFRF